MNFFVLLNIKEDTLKNVSVSGPHWLNYTIIVYNYSVFFSYYGSHGGQLSDYQYCSKYIILHSTAEGISYNNSIFIFVWTIPLKQPNIAAVAICVNNVNQTSERKSLTVLDWITFVK